VEVAPTVDPAAAADEGMSIVVCCSPQTDAVDGRLRLRLAASTGDR
jgi:hypothetical protein